MTIGSYKNSPFVTGHDSSSNGAKTEILNYGAQEWEQADDYPFGNRYINRHLETFTERTIKLIPF